MTRQVFFKLSRILEPDMVRWGHENSIKSAISITTLTWTRWSKMAKIPKIYGTSKVKTILALVAKEAKLQNLVGQCCWAKTLNWQVKPMMAFFHREEGKGRLPPPQALYPPRRLLRSLKFGPKTIDFASASEGNSWKKMSMLWTNVAKIFDVFPPFQLILCGIIMFI